MKFLVCSATLLVSSLAAAATPVNGWYSSVFGGYSSFPNNLSKRIDGLFFSRLSYENGFNAGGRLGYQSNPFRYELEYTYLQANARNFKVNLIRQTGISGHSNTNVGMANIYYDFPDVILPAISPFIGGGIGYAYLQTSISSTGPFDIVSFRRDRTAFAYQATAGLTYNFAENFALNASYRYLATTSSNEFGKTFQANIGDVGIIYRFDECSYK